jgi:lipopolysaccharide/colanic/teichoic acid biosynthesis glycosyltransferase
MHARRSVGERTALLSRCLDLFFGVPLLIAAAPILGAISLALLVERRGPVLYVQERLGFRGYRFRMLKFRTMIHGAERDTGPTWSVRGDRRVTGMGRLLRATHLDELPQILNVLRGEMSLVGPRPERPAIAAWLDTQIPEYWHRLDVLPGITGLAQIRTGYDTSIRSVRKKLRYDLFYIRQRSAWLYITVLLGTVWTVVGGTRPEVRREFEGSRVGEALPPFVSGASGGGALVP